MTFRDRSDIFIAEDTPTVGSLQVQFQFPTFALTLIARDVSFAQRILDFVSETKGNPDYRDLNLGDGRYRCMPEKTIDLSASFPESTFVIEKDGEFNDSYVFRVASPAGLCLQFDIRGELLETLVEVLRDISIAGGG